MSFVCLTSCVCLLIFGILDRAGMKRIMTVSCKIACNTFCPSGFYDRPLYYYAENTHPVVIVFGNIFPIVRFLAVGAGDYDDKEQTEWGMSADLPGYTEYREVTAENVYIAGENSCEGTGSENGENVSEATSSLNGTNDGNNADNIGGVNNADSADTSNEMNNENNTDNTSGVNNTDSKHENKDIGYAYSDTGKNSDGTAGNENSANITDRIGTAADNSEETYTVPAGSIPKVTAAVPYSYESLVNYDFVHDNFYVIPSHTALSKDLLKPEEFLQMDLSVKNKRPCVLLYHTHSQEAFADSDQNGMTIVQVGDYLEQLLKEKYGFDVIHITTEFDIMEGSLDRSKAYTYAEEEISEIVAEHPEIDMIIDLHRDGVNENLHFVTDINGKPTAKVMLFNGISYSNNQTNVDYLYNPYLEENLALTYQMFLLGKTYYPDFFRCIYIEAYRYNLHLCRRSMLIEAGAQTNSFVEVKNAMEPLAELIAREIYGEKLLGQRGQVPVSQKTVNR